MCNAYLGAFTGGLEFSNRAGVHISALFDEVGFAATQRTEGVFTAVRGGELRLYKMVSALVKNIFSYRKYRALVNVLNTVVGARYLIPIVCEQLNLIVVLANRT